MTVIPIKFPSDVERVRRDVAEVRDWTAEQRLQGVEAILHAICATAAGRAAMFRDPLNDPHELEWQRIMRDFIRRQLARQSQ